MSPGLDPPKAEGHDPGCRLSLGLWHGLLQQDGENESKDTLKKVETRGDRKMFPTPRGGPGLGRLEHPSELSGQQGSDFTQETQVQSP